MTRPTEEVVFLVWGPPSYANRTRLLAAELDIEVEHVYATRRRGALAAPFKYTHQLAATIRYLWRHRPELVFVQNPPSPAAVVVAVYSLLTGASFVVDSHTDAFLCRWWSRPEWLYRLVARRALATVVTNEHFAGLIERWGATPLVVRDIPTSFDHTPYRVGDDFNIAVVATFAFDEPIDEIVEAAESLPGVQFRITGDTRRENATIPTHLGPNVELTGFLESGAYYGLLRASDAVMALTTRDHTMQRGACEALSVGTPIITSDWSLLRDYFHRGTVHVDNTAGGIAAGVDEIWADIDRHRTEIVELRTEVELEWKRARERLLTLVESGTNNHDREGER